MTYWPDIMNMIITPEKGKEMSDHKDVKTKFLEKVIVNMLDLLDEDMFNDFCEDGKEAVLKAAEAIGYDKTNFAPDREVYLTMETSCFDLAHGLDVDDLEVEVVVRLDGKIIHNDEADANTIRLEVN